ncbi:hypothetical protein A6R68_06325, partial [Neotoma lepida]
MSAEVLEKQLNRAMFLIDVVRTQDRKLGKELQLGPKQPTRADLGLAFAVAVALAPGLVAEKKNNNDTVTKNRRLGGQLTCPLNSAVVLASYAVQCYLADSQFIPDQNDDFLSKVESLHEQHSGLKQSEAESCYINIARTLDFYGVELHGGR